MFLQVKFQICCLHLGSKGPGAKNLDIPFFFFALEGNKYLNVLKGPTSLVLSSKTMTIHAHYYNSSWEN